ncbi:hypothetical protein I4U23_014931 [Adineta vaga]|nr:hypothetical protein I4U23_014931 [Adineta vaga]
MNMEQLDGNKTNDSSITRSNQSETESPRSDKTNELSSQSKQASGNPTLCVLCSVRQRALALIPCGHFAVCVSCGHNTKSCPTCGKTVKGLIRVFD